MDSLIERRLAELESRIVALEASASTRPDQKPTVRYDEVAGTVSFGGQAITGAGEVEYQWHRPTDYLRQEAFASSLERVGALAHPVRHAIMQQLLTTSTSVHELVELGIVSSTGTAYHHISALQASGWVRKKDGVLSIPPGRIIPLLTIVAAGENH